MSGQMRRYKDFFFDGFLADVFVQSKIGDAKRQVSEAIDRVQNILGERKQEFCIFSLLETRLC